MSKSRNNPLIAGLRGKLGRSLVFRMVNGHMVVAVAPGKPRSAPTEQQQVQRNRFRMATAYASMQMEDPGSKALYDNAAKRKKYKSGQTLALSDYLHAPVVALVDASAYTGLVGSIVQIHAQDEMEVTAVLVELVSVEGVLVEQGSAMQWKKSNLWVYTATVENAEFIGGSVVVKAWDRPGNSTVKEMALM
ncbi:MAG TPA: hypothetical protein VIU12_14895 [Chryseolinea sp.]